MPSGTVACRTIDDGLFLHEVDAFDLLMAHCQEIERKANAPITR